MTGEKFEYFGDYLRALREGRRITLREFCRRAKADPANISRLERRLMKPPQNENILRRYAEAIGLERGSDEWYDFFDLASANNGAIPEHIRSDEELVKRLPAFFRTLRGEKPTAEEMQRLVDKIKREGF